MRIEGEKPFSIPTTSFAISASESGYSLNYSVDGNVWNAFATSVPANENLVVNFSPKGMLYKCVGNTSVLYIQY